MDLSQDEFGAVCETELRHACTALGVLTLQVLALDHAGVPRDRVHIDSFRV